MKKISLKTETSPEWLAAVCHSISDCPCKHFGCPFATEEEGSDCDAVTPEMWAELMEECDGNHAPVTE